MASTFLGRLRSPSLVAWVIPVLLLLGWEIGARQGWIAANILPAPTVVFATGWELLLSGELRRHFEVSAARAAAGFALGGGLGLALGMLTATSRLAGLLLDSSLQMVRNIPVLALVPLAIVWFGIDEGSKLFLVSVGVFFPMYLNTFHGIRSVDAGLIEMGRSYGLSGWRLYRHVILPGASASILVGIRYSLGLMWMVLIVAETISATSGIGYMTMSGREFLQIDIVLLGIFIYSLLGKLSDLAAQGLERFFLRWHPGYQPT